MLVVLGIGGTAAVVDAAGDHRAVDVAAQEVDPDFLADTGDGDAAPVGSGGGGQGGGDPHPGASLLIGGCARMALAPALASLAGTAGVG